MSRLSRLAIWLLLRSASLLSWVSPVLVVLYTKVPCLQDVGLSKILVNESTMMTSFQGTFEWAPPELINGGECSEKADIYSFGVILWEIVTAERPYRKQFRAAR